VNLRERITIKAAPERIWNLLADPAHWTKWNQKFVSIRRGRNGTVVPGEQFSMVSRLKRRDEPSEIMVREVMPLRRVTVLQLFTHQNLSRHVEVNLELSASDGGIQVTQTVDHKHAGIPFIFELLIWFVHRFGKPVGEGPLQRLKNLAEAAS
jgi:uncharacterized protein YndB with AHSA1/START domain